MATDYQVQVWQQGAAEAVVGPIRTGLQSIYQLTFDANGKFLYISGQGGETERLSLEPAFWRSLVCARARRNPTCEEWGRFRPGRAVVPVCPALTAPGKVSLVS